MKTTQTHTKGQNNNGQGRAALGFTGRIRAAFRNQQGAQELLIQQQAPWMNRH